MGSLSGLDWMANFYISKILGYWSAKSALKNILLALIYLFIYDFVYTEFLNRYYGNDVRGTFIPLADRTFIYYLIIGTFPFIFFRGIKTIAAGFSLFVYIFAYIPILYSLIAYKFPESITLTYTLLFSLFMSSFFITDNIYVFKYLFKRKKLLPITYIKWISIGGIVYLLIFNHSKLGFVNFISDSDLLYEQRMGNVLDGLYILSWLKGAFLPLLSVYYLKKRQYVNYIIVSGGFLLLFMLDKQKATFFLPLFLIFLYYVVKNYQNMFQNYFHSFLFLSVGISSGLLTYFCYTHSVSLSDNPVLFVLASLFIMRTQCIEGMELVSYMDFFLIQDHSFTHYGHVRILNAIFNNYPYPESIGEMVAGDGSCSNATFWLMDGVAAYGIIGVIIISIIFIVFKSMMNSVDIKCNKYLCLCIMMNGVLSMLNLSLFTSINTSGLLMLYIIFLLFDTRELKIV